MIDFLHFENRFLQETKIRDSYLLSPIMRNVSTETGDIPLSKKLDELGNPIFREPYYLAEFKNFIITYTAKDKLKVKGSLHKFYNDGTHNYNDFSEKQAKETLLRLCNTFDISFEKSILKGLEIGINIQLPFAPQLILDNCFLHIGITPEMKHDSNKGHYIQFEHSHYILKIYNKSLQYQYRGLEVDDNIMRFEIKFKKMEILNNIGIFNLKDLLDFDFKNFNPYLLKKWDEVLMYDITFIPKNRKEENYQHIKTWREYLNNKETSKLKYHRKKYQMLSLTQSENRKELIRNLIEEKIDSLTIKESILTIKL